MSSKAVEPEHPGQLRMELPAAHSAVRMARKVVRQFAETGGMAGDDLETLVLVTSELLANAVDHGGGQSAFEERDLKEPVRMLLELEFENEGWRLAVSDQGAGDPVQIETLLHPTGPPDLDDERGRGFFLLTTMVDSLTVARSADGRGLVFSAVKHHARRA